MFKQLDRYLYREMLAPLIIGVVFVVLLFQANLLIYLYKEMNMAGVPGKAIAQFILYKTPGFMVLTLPAGMALASSLAISRLARESELIAMRAGGASILRILRPVLVLSIVASVANWLINERVAPPAELEARKIQSEIGVLSVMPTFKQNVTLSLANKYTAVFGTVERLPNDTISLTDILLIERRALGENLVILATKGRYEAGNWTFSSPLAHVIRGATVVSTETKSDMVIREPIKIQQMFFSQQSNEQSTDELRELIKVYRSQRRDASKLEFDYASKFSVPMACFAFALIGASLSVWLGRRGPFIGVLVSVGAVWIFFNLFVISKEIIAPRGWVNPALAAWIPNLLLIGAGLFIVRRSE